MAGTEGVRQKLRKRSDTRYSVLVLNDRGLEQAISAGVPHVEIYVSASETHSSRNVGMSVEQALSQARSMLETAVAGGLGVTAGVMCAFGCYYEGAVSLEKVMSLVRELDRAPSVEIGLADTTGMADENAVRQTLECVLAEVEVTRVALHMHDTRGMGLANLKAALDLGVRRFDTAVGGLGGCPFVPGAAGNISTERTVLMLEGLGLSTGVDVARLAPVREMLARHLGKKLPAS